MAVADINKIKADTALYNGLPEGVPDTVTSPDAQSQIYSGILPTISHTIQQSPQLGESSRQLARQKTDRSKWSSTILRNMSLPLISGALNYILKRAAYVPSIIYRKLDLPLFRRRQQPGTASTRIGETLPDREQNTSIPQTGKIFTGTPQHYSDDMAEEGKSLHLSDEAYPAVIRNLFSPPATLNKMADLRHKLHIESPTTSISPTVSMSDMVSQANATHDYQTSHDGQNILPVDGISQTGTSLNQATMSSKPSQSIYNDRISSRTSSPLSQRISRKRETSARDKTGGPVQKSPNLSVRDSSVPRTVTAREKPIVTSIGQMKPISVTDEFYTGLSIELPAHYDYGAYQVTGSGQAAVAKGKTSTDVALEQDMPTIDKAVPRKSDQSSMPEIPNNKTRPSSKASPLQKTEPSGEVAKAHPDDSQPGVPSATGESVSKQPGQSVIPGEEHNIHRQPLKTLSVTEGELSDDYHIDSYQETVAESSIPTKSETTPAITVNKNNQTVNNAISRIANRTSIPLLPDVPGKQSLKTSQHRIAETSEEIIDEYNESRPVSNPVKSTITKPGTLSSTIDRTVTGKSVRPLMPETPVNHTRQPLIPYSHGRIEHDQEESLSTDSFVDTQIHNLKQSLTGKVPGTRSREYIQRTHETIHIPEDKDSNISDTKETNMATSKQDGIEERPAKINIGSRPFSLTTHVSDSPGMLTYPGTGNISSRITPISQRIFKSATHLSSSEKYENDVVPSDTENITRPTGYRDTSQRLLDFPVVSPVQREADYESAHSEEIYRALSVKTPEPIRPDSYSAPDLALVPAARKIEPVSDTQTTVNRQESQIMNSQEAAPNIRVIADKVYALLRQELKIERERERHRLLR